MALPTLQRKLFENDGYGPKIKDERLSTDITVKDWDASHDYPANVLAKAGGDIYRSVAASGPGTSAGAVNPTQDASAVYWEVFGKGGSVPVGTVIWLSTATVPVGFLLCNGQAVGRTTYPDLFDAIGTTYGAGDGSTTFNLPNLIDKFIEGANSNIGDNVAAGLPNITGEVGRGGNRTFTVASGAFSGVTTVLSNYQIQDTTGTTTNYRSASFDASRSSSIYGNSSTVQPPAVKLLPCIKAYSDVDNLGSLDVAQLENYVQNNVVHKTGDENISGAKTFKHGILIDDYFSYLTIRSNNFDASQASVSNETSVGGLYFDGKDSAKVAELYVKEYPSGQASIYLALVGGTNHDQYHGVSLFIEADGSPAFRPVPSNTNKMNLGTGSYRWRQLFATTTTISTSDARKKSTITSVPDNVLDAWENVNFVQYQFNDALQEKGSAARFHNGLIAQNIDNVFKQNNLDASRYGLFCYDEWEAEPERKDEKGNIIQPSTPAGNQYSLRYEEALCMEAAYQRRRADRAEARIASLEARLAALEAKLNG